MAEWTHPPSDSGRRWFEETIGGHSKVVDLETVADQTYVVRRSGMSDIRVWLCDIYTLGIADYTAIMTADPELDAIVVLSQWNHYTPQARQLGEADGVGLFKPGEFMSALHRDGDEFVAASDR